MINTQKYSFRWKYYHKLLRLNSAYSLVPSLTLASTIKLFRLQRTSLVRELLLRATWALLMWSMWLAAALRELTLLFERGFKLRSSMRSVQSVAAGHMRQNSSAHVVRSRAAIWTLISFKWSQLKLWTYKTLNEYRHHTANRWCFRKGL